MGNPAKMTFSALAPKSPMETHFILFAMPPSWFHVIKVLKGHKENVVIGMANLSNMDDKGSRKLTGGSTKPNGE